MGNIILKKDFKNSFKKASDKAKVNMHLLTFFTNAEGIGSVSYIDKNGKYKTADIKTKAYKDKINKKLDFLLFK